MTSDNTQPPPQLPAYPGSRGIAKRKAGTEKGAKKNRGSKREHAERVAATRYFLERGFKDGEIKRLIASQTGCNTRTVEKYLALARKEMLEEHGHTKAEHEVDALEFYAGIAKNNGQKTRDRILARNAMDKILGLNKPQQIAIEQSPQGPSAIDMASLRQDILNDADYLEFLRSKASGSADGDSRPAGDDGEPGEVEAGSASEEVGSGDCGDDSEA